MFLKQTNLVRNVVLVVLFAVYAQVSSNIEVILERRNIMDKYSC
ncbi:hypothetical protein APHWI1_1183 [Anaplasma phagocytophilum str. ApWI1]|uniref:Uncharacterized protein n=3 Tax=Anaplasma phagocytophilum TaxID=948 RepID=Q2GLE6_ANAPZ|nr:hypothetical protein APH_0182 [Anaplasma phagocytophilum str. HZ]KJV59729.1 hypothetical protein APHWEB_0334 [Anaplasma phagocytophilum str. Webster]KJV68588.1 hypothetical protein EPHNCH_0395 [Anaplasma phagocytophilum str. NCH-1]KJV83135.1 hypothetical protein APHHGE2_0408 [Anaplasma phagocytophilum str. HGE2]KJV85196.1 hypothetical protein APHWI1_1183 [Anaplasma phagocytophilum str. ApWI1]KJV88174.1 hypothetical protein APHNYW_0136 [Anaplasma phagocytophilum str. ApNYW]KJV99414.1 hypoth